MIKVNIEVDEQLKNDTIEASKAIAVHGRKVWGSLIDSMRREPKQKMYTEAEVIEMMEAQEK